MVFWPPGTTVAEAGRGAVGVAQRPASANWRTPVWHPSLPNYVAMITGDWVGTDVVATGHTYPAR